jgi:hypothetical protein
MDIFLITLCFVIILVLGYATYNLLVKVERLEDTIVDTDSFITNFISKIDLATERLEEIDAKGTFQGDDEVGWFFKSLQDLQEELQSYANQYASQEESQ